MEGGGREEGRESRMRREGARREGGKGKERGRKKGGKDAENDRWIGGREAQMEGGRGFHQDHNTYITGSFNN